MHVYRQRFRNLVDSGPHFRTDVYATWLSPGICANPLSYCRLIRIAFSAGISFCSTVSWIPATLQTRRETGYLLFVSFALSTYLLNGWINEKIFCIQHLMFCFVFNLSIWSQFGTQKRNEALASFRAAMLSTSPCYHCRIIKPMRGRLDLER